MQAIASRLSEQQVEDVATYFARLDPASAPPPPRPAATVNSTP
jgi:cytochrome c553